MIIPGLMFGTLNVLGPLRLDALGAGAAAIAGCFLVASALEAVVAPVAGRISDRRGRRAPAIAGLASSAVVMALLPWPDAAWQLAVLIVLAAPAIGILWSPAIATMSDGAERHGIEQAIAFAFVNVAWALGQTAGAAGSARLADATGDRVPFLLLAGIGALTAAGAPAGSIALPAAMAAENIDGKAIAQAVRAEVRADVEAWVAQGNPKPGLATVLVGDDPASAVYVGGKQKASAEAGIEGFDHRLPHDAAHEEVSRLLSRLNDDPAVSGILLQLPTPPQVDGAGADRADRPGQGRRRAHADLRRAAGQGPPRPAPVHARRRDGDAAPPRRRARGRRGRRRRPLRPRRQADLGAAARRQRHRHHLPLAHARPRGGLPPRRRARRRGRPPGVRPGRLGQGGRDGHRRRHQPDRRRARRRRRLRGGRRARAR